MGEIKPFEDRHYKRTLSYDYATVGPEHEADCLEALCEGFVRANQIMIRAQPDAYPCCLGCGKYRYVEPKNCRVFDWKRGRAPRVDPNCQHVWGAYGLHKRKAGTCIDLACMMAAIYREKEDEPKARVVIEHQFGDKIIDVDEAGEPVYERLDGLYHAMVMLGDGSIVDPTHKVINPQKGPARAEVCGCSSS